jgi:hypothetical protein
MPTVLTAHTVRLVSKPYSFNGHEGVSHKLTLSDGDDLVTVKVPQDVFDALEPATLEALTSLGNTVEVWLHTPRMFTADDGRKTFSLRARAVRVAERVAS